MNGPYQMLFPLTFGDKVYDQITLREPTLGEMKKARVADPTGMEGYQASLIGQQLALPTAVIDKMCSRDFQALSGFLAELMAATLDAS